MLKGKENKNYRYRLNLQYFNGDVLEGGGEAAQPVVNEQIEQPVNPLLEGIQQPENQSQQPTNGNPEESLIDIGGRKINPSDPNALNAVIEDYRNLNRQFTQTSQQLKQFETINQQYQTMLQQQQFQQQPPQQQQQNQGIQFTDEEKQAFFDEAQEKQYELNPIEFQRWQMQHPIYQEMMREQYQELLSPILQPFKQSLEQQQAQKDYANAVNSLREKYQDFQEYSDDIIQIFEESEKNGVVLGPNDLEAAYERAKGRKAANMSPENLLNDPNFIQQILNNEQIKNQILQSHVQQINQQNQQTPNLMGNANPGMPTTLGQEKPKSITDGSKAFARFLGINY